MTPEILETARYFATLAYPHESVGLVVERGGSTAYIPCTNISDIPDTISVDPKDIIAAEDGGRIVGVVHSHTNGSVRPSETDIKSCTAWGVPWWIVDAQGSSWERVDPIGRKIEGRSFVMGVDDCWALAREWYGVNFGFTFSDYLRRDEFWKFGEVPHIDHYRDAGFIEVYGTPIPGDGFLMAVGADSINHCAVYLGDGKILHHVTNRLSRIDLYDDKWQKRTRMVVRHV